MLHLDKVLEAAAQKMRAEFEATKDISDELTKGRAREAAVLRNVLTPYLPSRYSISSAVVVSSHGGESRQQDLVIYDSANSPVLYDAGSEKVLFAESVLASLEAKSKLNRRTIRNAVQKAASLHGLPRSFRSLVQLGPGLAFPAQQPPVQIGLVGFESETKLSTLAKALAEERRKVKDGWSLAYCCVLHDPDGQAGVLVSVSPDNAKHVLAAGGPDSRVATVRCETPGEALIAMYTLIMEHLHSCGAIRAMPDVLAYLDFVPRLHMAKSELAGAKMTVENGVVDFTQMQRLIDLGKRFNEGEIEDKEIPEFYWLISQAPGAQFLEDASSWFDLNGSRLKEPTPSALLDDAKEYLAAPESSPPDSVVEFIRGIAPGSVLELRHPDGRRAVIRFPAPN